MQSNLQGVMLISVESIRCGQVAWILEKSTVDIFTLVRDKFILPPDNLILSLFSWVHKLKFKKKNVQNVKTSFCLSVILNFCYVVNVRLPSKFFVSAS